MIEHIKMKTENVRIWFKAKLKSYVNSHKYGAARRQWFANSTMDDLQACN